MGSFMENVLLKLGEHAPALGLFVVLAIVFVVCLQRIVHTFLRHIKETSVESREHMKELTDSCHAFHRQISDGMSGLVNKVSASAEKGAETLGRVSYLMEQTTEVMGNSAVVIKEGMQACDILKRRGGPS